MTTLSTGLPGIWIGTRSRRRPRAYVSGPAKIRVVESGPARIAVEVSRETAGSRFVQTIRLSAGDAGRRVEFANVIDWNTTGIESESDISSHCLESDGHL